jgi:hypothetical protein
LTGVCLVVAGALRAAIPTDAFALAWQHSVEKTRWEEHYRIDRATLRLVEARVTGFGAGMEPGAGAIERDGQWIWNPDRTLGELRLAWSSYVADYELCARLRCAPLARWTGPLEQGDVVTIKPCDPAGREIRQPRARGRDYGSAR